MGNEGNIRVLIKKNSFGIKILLIFILSLALILSYQILTNSFEKKSPPINKMLGQEGPYLTYNNYEYGFSIDYPTSWDKDKEINPYAIISFLAPLEDTSDDFTENLNIMIDDISSSPMTLEEYSSLSLEQISKMYNDLEIIDDSDTYIGKYPARRLIYTTKQGVYNIKYTQIFTILDDQSYILTFTEEKGLSPSYEIIRNKMINSFNINYKNTPKENYLFAEPYKVLFTDGPPLKTVFYSTQEGGGSLKLDSSGRYLLSENFRKGPQNITITDIRGHFAIDYPLNFGDNEGGYVWVNLSNLLDL